jgi:hypothetical protein
MPRFARSVMITLLAHNFLLQRDSSISFHLRCHSSLRSRPRSNCIASAAHPGCYHPRPRCFCPRVIIVDQRRKRHSSRRHAIPYPPPRRCLTCCTIGEDTINGIRSRDRRMPPRTPYFSCTDCSAAAAGREEGDDNDDKDVRVYALDPLGCGWSSKPFRDDPMAVLANGENGRFLDCCDTPSHRESNAGGGGGAGAGAGAVGGGSGGCGRASGRTPSVLENVHWARRTAAIESGVVPNGGLWLALAGS